MANPSPVVPRYPTRRPPHLYGVFFKHFTGRDYWALSSNRREAITYARSVRGLVLGMRAPDGGGPWDAPTFRALADEQVADYR